MKYFNIPIFVPHLGCPFDCVFCNQKKITGAVGNVDEKEVRYVIEEHLKKLPQKDCETEIAFFGGSFTGIEEALQERLLSCACEYVGKSNITGIRVSTRPDYIDHAVMTRLLKYKATTVELGVQSMDEEVLKAACRGHSAKDVEDACAVIKQYPIKLGLQMMTGLPADTREKSLETADKLIALKPDFVRIYPTLVIEGTELLNLYRRGEYIPQSVDEAADLCRLLFEKFESSGIRVIRTGLQNTDEISPEGAVAAGPYHSAFGELVESRVYFDKISEAVKPLRGDEITIFVNPSEVSKAVGHKRMNIIRAQKELGKKIKVKPAPEIEKGQIGVFRDKRGGQ